MKKETKNLLFIAIGAILGSLVFIAISGWWDGWLF
jgi:hypothetical protein